MEIWDLYTRDRRPTGKTHVRGDEIPDGFYHVAVHVWIKNSEGKYIISQRAASRPTFPLKYECVGGAVLAGEDSLHGALREAEEEIGLKLDADKGRLLFTQVRDVINGRIFRDILDVWLFECDDEPNLLRATTDEVYKVVKLTREEFLKLAHEKKTVETLAYFFDKIEPQK